MTAISGCSSSESTSNPAPSTPVRTESATPIEETATQTSTPSPTPSPTPTPTPTPEPLPSGYINANSGPFEGATSSFVGYAYSEAKITVHPSAVPDGFSDTAKVVVTTFEYPLRQLVRYGESDSFSSAFDEPKTKDVEMDTESNLNPDYLHHVALLLPGDKSIQDASEEDVVKLSESNRFEVSDGEISQASHPAGLERVETNAFERIPAEGAYILKFSGSTLGRTWSVRYLIYKSVYIQRILAPRGRSRDEYVAIAQQQGVADTLGQLLKRSADRNGFTDKRERAAFLIDYVQNLPYVPDDVSKGYDDYTKFVTETVAEGSGDCEDTAVLMAALLQSEPFGYDCVLILLPGHMATGVYGTDLPGTYYTYQDRDYYYLETTGEGWGVGDIPEMYQNERARLYQV